MIMTKEEFATLVRLAAEHGTEQAYTIYRELAEAERFEATIDEVQKQMEGEQK